MNEDWNYWLWLEERYGPEAAAAATEEIQRTVKAMHESCDDNYRLAACDDGEALVLYEEAIDGGCCGRYDSYWTFAGRRYKIGYNYGH